MAESRAASFLVPSQTLSSTERARNRDSPKKRDGRYQDDEAKFLKTQPKQRCRTSVRALKSSSTPSQDQPVAVISRQLTHSEPLESTGKAPSSGRGGDEVVSKGAKTVTGGIGAKTNSEGGKKVTKKKKKQPKKQTRMSISGNIPDVHWRAIPMEHLRHHPIFDPLPNPNSIMHLKTLEDVRYFRQDSWQWDALHAGRCTTSQAAAALGLLEPKVGGVLGIPRSLRKGGVGAYHRLGQTALRDVNDMSNLLCTGGNEEERNGNAVKLWIANRLKGRSLANGKRPYPFAAIYTPRITRTECEERRERVQDFYASASPFSARMQWGNTQEATSILTALNYFWKSDPDVVIREVGMCGAGLAMNRTDGVDTGLLIGASPDAVIYYPSGECEVLEVKNHCPFVPTSWGDQRGSKPKKRSKENNHTFRIRELPIQASVPAAYIPQLMMEMLSLGSNCRSAVMVRQTATNGAVILRLHRDDEWISEMLYWLNRFMADFVNKSVTPPPNFFWDGNRENVGGDRYRDFVRRTKEIGECAELVDYVKHSEIQRVVSADQYHIPLFLD